MKTYAHVLLVGVVIPLLLSGCGSDNQPTAGSGQPEAGRELPDIVSAKALDSKSILVEFSEPAGTPAEQPSSYLILDSRSEKLTVHDVELNGERTEATLSTEDQSDSEVYTLAFESISAVAVLVETSDPPRVVGAISTSNTTVVVTFNKKMSSGAEDPVNYAIA